MGEHLEIQNSARSNSCLNKNVGFLLLDQHDQHDPRAAACEAPNFEDGNRFSQAPGSCGDSRMIYRHRKSPRENMGKSSINGGFNGKIIYRGPASHVSLPEGT